MIFIISTSNDNINSEGNFYWRNNYLPAIKKFIPENIVDIISIASGIIYFNKAAQKELYAVKIKILSTHISSNYLKIHYSVESKTELKSYQIRDGLKKYFGIKNLMDIPFCTAVDENKFTELLANNKIISDVMNLEIKNDWNCIYKIMEQYFPLEKSEIWNDAELLNKFSFAAAKLSECSENLKKKFSDNKKRIQFVADKRKFRNLAIKLRNRCIEITPDNPAYLSNLAYSYYQSVSELNTPGSRRDGNIKDDAQAALKYINLALQLEPTRITELYRKGFLLSETFYNYLLFNPSNDNENNTNRFNTVNDYVREGIIAFEKAVIVFENDITDDFTLKRYKKYYIKSLYHLAQKYLQLSRINFNIQNLIFGKEIFNEDKEYVQYRLSLLDKAEFYIDKCILKDYNRNKEEKFLIDKAEVNNIVSGVYKTYIKGLINLYFFILTKKTKHIDTAKEYFQKSLEINYPRELQNQNKLFILEKIAELNIIENKPDAAIKLLEPIYKRKNNLFPYVAYTLAIAYRLNNQTDEFNQIVKKYSENSDTIFRQKFQMLSDKKAAKTVAQTSVCG